MVGKVVTCGSEVVDEGRALSGTSEDELTLEMLDVLLDGDEVVEHSSRLLGGVEAVLELVA